MLLPSKGQTADPINSSPIFGLAFVLTKSQVTKFSSADSNVIQYIPVWVVPASDFYIAKLSIPCGLNQTKVVINQLKIEYWWILQQFQSINKLGWVYAKVSMHLVVIGQAVS